MSVALMLSATASFALPNCPSNTTKVYDNCFGTINYDNGDKYIGEWKGDRRHGQGTIIFSNDTTYFGEWKNGRRDGQGTYTFPNGNKYVGEFKNDKRHGQGTFTFADGGKDVGAFKDGKLNGYAVSYSSDGSVLKEGIWKDDEFQYARKNPNAVKPSPLKAAYIKLSKSQRKQVQSILSDLGLYKSSIDGLYGKGTAAGLTAFNKKNLNGADLTTSDNVSKLMAAVLALHSSPIPKPKVIQNDILPACPSSGYFHNCFGTYTFADGATYVGEYKNDKINGQGTYTYADGDTYVGEFKDDERNGQGTYTFADGDT